MATPVNLILAALFVGFVLGMAVAYFQRILPMKNFLDETLRHFEEYKTALNTQNAMLSIAMNYLNDRKATGDLDVQATLDAMKRLQP